MSQSSPVRTGSEAKQLLQQLPGVRAVAIQKARGGELIVVSVDRGGVRRSAGIECRGGVVNDRRAVSVVAGLMGSAAAATYSRLAGL